MYKENSFQKLSADVLVFSDLHIVDPEEKNAKLLYDTLERIDPKYVQYIIFLGDTFNFCFGSEFYAKKFHRFGALCSTLREEGVSVIHFEGNHEFRIDKMNWHGIEFVTVRDKTITLKTGTAIKFSHGDLIKFDIGYRILRAILKSKIVYAIAAVIPGSWLDSFAINFSKIRHIHGDRKNLNHQKIIDSAFSWVDESICQHGIFGHFHEPYYKNRQSKKNGHLIGVPGWERPNFLIYRNNVFMRCYLSETGAPFVLQELTEYPL